MKAFEKNIDLWHRRFVKCCSASVDQNLFCFNVLNFFEDCFFFCTNNFFCKIISKRLLNAQIACKKITKFNLHIFTNHMQLFYHNYATKNKKKNFKIFEKVLSLSGFTCAMGVGIYFLLFSWGYNVFCILAL